VVLVGDRLLKKKAGGFSRQICFKWVVEVLFRKVLMLQG